MSSFPTTPVLDYLVDPAAPEVLSSYSPANWSIFQTFEENNELSTIVGGGALGDTSLGSNGGNDLWLPQQFTDFEVWGQVRTSLSTLAGVPHFSVYGRITPDLSGAGYFAWFQSTGAHVWRIGRMPPGGGLVNLLSGNLVADPQPGDGFGLSCVGSLLTIYYRYGTNAAFLPLGSVVNTVLQSSGYIGIGVHDPQQSGSINMFGGGPPATPLTGNVLLRSVSGQLRY